MCAVARRYGKVNSYIKRSEITLEQIASETVMTNFRETEDLQSHLNL